MGADITVYDKNGEKAAHFRDSYNDYCLLWLVGKSWWVDIAGRETDRGRINELIVIGESILNRIEWIREAFNKEWADHYLRKVTELGV